MVEMQAEAVRIAQSSGSIFPPKKREATVEVNGYIFRVTRDNSGKITNAFPIIPIAEKTEPTIPPLYKSPK